MQPRRVAPQEGIAYAVTVMSCRWFFASMIAALLALTFNPGASAEEFDSQTIERVDQYITEQVKAYNIPGASVAIVSEGELRYSKGYGTAQPDGTAMRAQTPVHTGSAVQTLTAAAIVQLWENGRLELDEPISAYLEDEIIGDHIRAYGDIDQEVLNSVRRITVEQLLTHTSGISADGRINSEAGGDAAGAFDYSSVNYDLAGAVVEAVSGQSYSQYVEENFFAPLSMDGSRVLADPASNTRAHDGADDGVNNGTSKTGHAVAQGHARGLFNINLPREVDVDPRKVASSGLVCSSESAARFLSALLSAGGPVLSAKGVDQLVKPRGSASGPGVGEETAYGLGLLVERSASPSRVWHSGTSDISQASFHLFPEEDLGIVVAINVNGPMLFGLSETLALGLQHVIAGEAPVPFEPLERAQTTKIIVTVAASFSLLRLLVSINVFRLRRRRNTYPRVTPRNVLVHAVVPLLVDAAILFFFLVAVPAGFNASFAGLADAALELFMLSVLAAVPLGGWALLRTVFFFTENR